jgi:hypothetical protein
VLKSIASGDGFYYIATSINTFRIDGALMNSYPKSGDAISWVSSNILNSKDSIVSVPGETIVQVATAGTYFFAGTNHGLYVANIDSVGRLAGAATLVGSASDLIVSLSATAYAGDVYAAAVTGSNKLVILKNGSIMTWNGKPAEFDAMSGVPSGQAIPTWWNKGTGLVLLVAGENAAVRMNVVAP